MSELAALEIKSSKPAVPSVLILVLAFVGEIVSLAVSAFRFLIQGKVSVRNILHQMSAIGVDALPIAITTTLSTGAVFALYTAGIFVQFGASTFLGGMLTLSFVLELGPLLAGITVASRSGAAIAAEIGSMVVTEQVDALRSLAVSPIRYLVAPRLIACIIVMPIVGVFADLSGVFGCYLMSRNAGIPGQVFIESARTMVTQTELFKGLVKTVVFGALIAIISCQQGLRTKGGATGVGRATTSSVVLCVVVIFIADFFLAQILTGPALKGR